MKQEQHWSLSESNQTQCKDGFVRAWRIIHQVIQDWTCFMEQIAGQYGSAEKITLVMDNLNTHNPGSFYEVFPPDKAKALWDRFELVYTPKHGSWLNMAEIELNVLKYIFLKALQFVYLF